MKNFLLAIIILLFIGRLFISHELQIVDAFTQHDKAKLINGIGGFYCLIISALLVFIKYQVKMNVHYNWFVSCGLTYALTIGVMTWYPFLPDLYAYYIGTYFFLPFFQTAYIVVLSLFLYLYLCFKHDWLKQEATV